MANIGYPEDYPVSELCEYGFLGSENYDLYWLSQDFFPIVLCFAICICFVNLKN